MIARLPAIATAINTHIQVAAIANSVADFLAPQQFSIMTARDG